jgi:hypothetical protein
MVNSGFWKSVIFYFSQQAPRVEGLIPVTGCT